MPWNGEVGADDVSYPTPRRARLFFRYPPPSPYTGVPCIVQQPLRPAAPSDFPPPNCPTLPALPADLPPPNCPAKYTVSTQHTPPALANKGFCVNSTLNFAFLRRLRPHCQLSEQNGENKSIQEHP